MISFWYVLFQTHRKDYDKDKMQNVIDTYLLHGAESLLRS